jgi:hypothetical protein
MSREHVFDLRCRDQAFDVVLQHPLVCGVDLGDSSRRKRAELRLNEHTYESSEARQTALFATLLETVLLALHADGVREAGVLVVAV